MPYYPPSGGSGGVTNVSTDVTLTGGPITSTGTLGIATSAALPGSPTTTTQTANDNSTKVATTAYVDNAVLSQNYKEACKYSSVAALPSIVYANGSSGVGATLTGVALAAISLDSSSPAVNDRVLIKNQVSTFQNGIYTVTATGSGIAVFVLTRTTDTDQATDYKTGDAVFITAGSTLANTTWAYTGIDSPTMGTSAITYVQVAGPGSFTGGTGITITGTSIAIDTSVTVDKTTAQTLTNKTLTSPTLTTPDLGTPTAGVATNLTGTASSLTAGKATVLATARNINGVSFDGSASIGPDYIYITSTSNISTSSTSWSGISNIASLSTVANSGITISGSTLTFTHTGVYEVTGNISAFNTSCYLGLRIRRTNNTAATLAQNTSYSAGTVQPNGTLVGIFTISATNDSVDIQYAISGTGSTFVGITLDSEVTKQFGLMIKQIA